MRLTAQQGGRRSVLQAPARAYGLDVELHVPAGDAASVRVQGRDAPAGDGDVAAAGARMLQAPGGGSVALEIAFQATSVEAIERFELLAASGVGIDVQGALQAALTDSLGAKRPQVLSVAVLPAAAAPVPAPSSSGVSSSAPAPAAAKVRWATAAVSPRYAPGARPTDVALASAKAVGAPQLLTIPGLRCKSNLAIAWGPTMARPRVLQLTYSPSVPVSVLEGVVVAVVNIGTTAAPLQSIDLLVLPLGAAASSSPVVLNLYTHRVGDAKPACPAVNTYAMPSGLVTGPYASARVVGVRLRPSQDRVAGKGALLQVDAVGLRLK